MKQSAKMIAILSAFSLSMGVSQSVDAQNTLRRGTAAIGEEPPSLVESSLFIARELDTLLADLDTITVKTLD
ncbi:MAG: hypothetical protein K2K95_01745, partial [Muribaculaceae bacterium]|nr:hypothetical protein [Muribaculaceae bacterium]